jgi:hypothetical protein
MEVDFEQSAIPRTSIFYGIISYLLLQNNSNSKMVKSGSLIQKMPIQRAITRGGIPRSHVARMQSLSVMFLLFGSLAHFLEPTSTLFFPLYSSSPIERA